MNKNVKVFLKGAFAALKFILGLMLFGTSFAVLMYGGILLGLPVWGIWLLFMVLVIPIIAGLMEVFTYKKHPNWYD